MNNSATSSDVPGSGRKRVLFVLKTNGPQTAVHIAKRLGVTTMAVRQHLALLEGEALIDFTLERRKVGRPIRRWRLTDKGYDLFPDRHAELAIAMLEAVGDAFGENGYDRFAETLTRLQVDTYRARMPPAEAPLEERVACLARIRLEEGYMAESRLRLDGVVELVENHCSIAKAARLCSKLCGSELSLFQAILGERVRIERVEHILSGDPRCTFSISEPSKPGTPPTNNDPLTVFNLAEKA